MEARERKDEETRQDRQNGNKVIYILSVVSDYVLHTSSPLFPLSLDGVCVLL